MPHATTRPRSARDPRPRALRACALALTALLALLAAPAGAAQILPASPAFVSIARQESEPGASYASPREVVRAFLELADKESALQRRDAAVSLFDLSDVPESKRIARAEEAAQRLERILARVAKLDAADFPDAEEVAGETVWERVIGSADRSGVEVRLGFAQVGDGWRFDRATLASLGGWWEALREKPLIKGATQLPDLVRELVPARLQEGGFLLEHYQWIGLALLVLLGVVLDRIVIALLRPLIRRLSRTNGQTLEAKLLGDFERPLGALVTVLVFMAGLAALDLHPRPLRVLEIAASLVLAVAGVWATYRLVDVVCWVLAQRAARTENTFDDMLVPLLRRTLKVFVLVVGLVYVASRISGDVWHVFAGLSIGSLAIGFAAKDSIENLFGTFTVLLDKPFKLGDKIRVGSGLEGVVEDVGFRSTRLRTFDDSLITVPNSRFIASDVDNLGARRFRRIRTLLGLTYDTPPEKIDAFCEGVRELIRRHPHTIKRDYSVWLHAFNSSSLDVFLQFQLDVPNDGTEWRERHRLFADILRLSKSLGVSFAFPTQTQHLTRPEDLEHKDAPPTSAAAVEVGRSRAQEIANASLDATPPAPLRFDPTDPDAAGLAPKRR